jgi:hypothetical protein
MSKYFYGFRYYSGRSTTTGQPNKKNGRYSIAGSAIAFKSKEELNAWLLRENRIKASGLGGGIRDPIKNRKQLRNLNAGLDWRGFCEYLNNLHWQCDNEE